MFVGNLIHRRTWEDGRGIRNRIGSLVWTQVDNQFGGRDWNRRVGIENIVIIWTERGSSDV